MRRAFLKKATANQQKEENGDDSDSSFPLANASIEQILQNQQRIIAELVTSNQLLLKVIQKQDERRALLETLSVGRLEAPKETETETENEMAGQDINRQTKPKTEGKGPRSEAVPKPFGTAERSEQSKASWWSRLLKKTFPPQEAT